MFGLLLFVCILAVFGFILSWIAGVIGNEEISVPKSMAIIFTNGIVQYFVGLGVAEMGIGGSVIQFAISLVILGVLLWILADIPIKKGIIIAAIFAVLTLLAGLVIALMFSTSQG